jgi:hypothetical protein
VPRIPTASQYLQSIPDRIAAARQQSRLNITDVVGRDGQLKPFETFTLHRPRGD